MIGFFIGLAYLPIVISYDITLSNSLRFTSSVLYLLYPLTILFNGFGALAAHKFPKVKNKKLFSSLTGLSFLIFLFINLLRNPFDKGDTLFFWTIHFINFFFLVFWYFLNGFNTVLYLKELKKSNSVKSIYGWAVHLIFIGIGTLLSDIAIQLIGGNALLLLIGLSMTIIFLFLKTGLSVALLLTITFPIFEVDKTLELMRISSSNITRLKKKELSDNYDMGRFWAYKMAQQGSLIYQKWSRVALFQLFETNQDKKFIGVANYKQLWSFPKKLNPDAIWWRKVFYENLKPNSKVVAISTGGGRSLGVIPKDHNHDITFVEHLIGATDYFAEIRPDRFEHQFKLIKPVYSEGRYFLESSPEKFDAIYFEGAIGYRNPNISSLARPYHLYTDESMDMILSRLKDDGIFVMEIIRTSHGSVRKLMEVSVSNYLKVKGIPHHVFKFKKKKKYGGHAIYASKSQKTLDRFISKFENVKYKDFESILKGREALSIRDQKPFAYWLTIPKKAKTKFFIGSLIFLMIILQTFWTYRKSIGTNLSYFFFFIGLGQVALQTHTMVWWRSYFGDHGITTLIIISLFAFFSAGVSILLTKEKVFSFVSNNLFKILFILSACHYLSLLSIPFDMNNIPLRWLLAAILLIPSGILVGLFFPIGLKLVSEKNLTKAYFIDSLGLVATYPLFILVLVNLGMNWFLVIPFAAYLLAVKFVK